MSRQAHKKSLQYTYATASVVVPHFQRSSSPKPLGQSKPNFIEAPWEGGAKVYINGPGHMTKMAVTPIYGKHLQNSSPEPKVL